jgi:type II secretory pathway pseudopilin PulG
LSRAGRLQTRRRSAAAFTLLELLAIVAIFALMTTFVLPNIGAVRDRALRSQAQRLAAQLELARQRAVVTGTPHRLLIDLDGAAYRLEWLEGGGHIAAPKPSDPVEYDVRGSTPLPLAAPRAARAEYEPVPGRFGDFQYLDSEFGFAGIETPEGWIEQGDSFIAFDRDGTASYTEILIDDESGRQIVLDVLPLADAVRIRDAES